MAKKKVQAVVRKSVTFGPGSNKAELLAGLEAELGAAMLGGFMDKIKAIQGDIAAIKGAK